MELSCSLAPGPMLVEQVRLAEQLGYKRVWLYDSPNLYWDVGVSLGLLTGATSRIGLGIGVLVPSLRDVVATATLIATVERLNPGRLAIAVATGFTGRILLGQRPMPWNEVTTFTGELRRLLDGDSIRRESGESTQLLHPEGWTPQFPIATPILIAAAGPRGYRAARELGDGLMLMSDPPEFASDFTWCAMSVAGTVLDVGETPESPRVREAVAASVSMIYRYTYEVGGPDGVDALPGGQEWRKVIEEVEPTVRRREMHRRTALGATDRERDHLSPQLIAATFTGSPRETHLRVKQLEERGVTEIVYAPSGPDVPRELRSMAEALG